MRASAASLGAMTKHSRAAAQEHSPGRKPWVPGGKEPAPKGAKEQEGRRFFAACRMLATLRSALARRASPRASAAAKGKSSLVPLGCEGPSSRKPARRCRPCRDSVNLPFTRHCRAGLSYVAARGG